MVDMTDRSRAVLGSPACKDGSLQMCVSVQMNPNVDGRVWGYDDRRGRI